MTTGETISADVPLANHRILVDWGQTLPSLMLLRCARIALDARLLVLAALGLALMLGGWWVLGKVFSGARSEEVRALLDQYGHGAWALRASEPTTESISAEMPQGPSVSGTIYFPGARWLPFNPFVGSWDVLSRPFRGMFFWGLNVVGFTFLLLCGLWAVVVWAFFGGAISRIAAVRFARDERCSLRQALHHARSRYGAYFWAPLFPLVGVLLLSLPILAVAWLLRLNLGLFLLALVWPLFLVLGLVMAMFLVGLVFGWPLMWATISTEGTDSFDALSRTYAYVYQRPLYYLGYAVLVTVLGWVAAVFVQFFAFLVVAISFWAASWTAGGQRSAEIIDHIPALVDGFAWLDGRLVGDAVANEAARLGSIGSAGVAIMAFWIGCVQFLALGFGLSYFWTASAGIYLLLRNRVDNTELDEIYLEDEETHYGLPPLDEDEAGVPKVGDEEPSAPTADGAGNESASRPAEQVGSEPEGGSAG